MVIHTECYQFLQQGHGNPHHVLSTVTKQSHSKIHQVHVLLIDTNSKHVFLSATRDKKFLIAQNIV